MSDSDSKTNRRVFFALWPDAWLRDAIAQRRQQLGDLSRRRVPDYNLHLTLLFLGDQPAAQVDPLISAVNDLSAQRFTLILDQFGWFERPRVVWLGGDPVAGGVRLVEALTGVSKQLELQFFERAWKPHITLFRKVDAAPQIADPEPLVWSAKEFVLIESLPNRPYEVLQRWKLDE